MNTSGNTSVAITGYGAITCNGTKAHALLQSALVEQSGIKNGLGRISNQALEILVERYPSVKTESKSVIIAYAAMIEAMEQAGWTALGPTDGFILGTTTGQISLWEPGLLQYLNHAQTIEDFSPAFGEQSLGLTLSRLAEHFKFTGPSLVTASACSASTQALGIAASWIRSGKVKRCLVGGVEVLSHLTTEGFRCLQLLSETPCTPFDVNRMGINLSEGAGFICLEASSGVAHKKALAYLSGFGFSTDAYHLASPHPEGEGSKRAMEAALKSANLNLSDITWVCAHGTGSKANDLAEGLAVKNLFGEASPWMSSTKHIHGHALGASGAIETILAIEAMRNNVVLKTSGLKLPDPKIPARHPEVHLKTEVKHILKNTLGFGGNNATLILSRGNV
jgi:3-oxoacyl-(acyl-carrier-protein) synthase